MAIKRISLGLLLFTIHVSFVIAQDVVKNINKVKRDTMYIYAEATTKELSESYANARTLLEVQVGDWVRQQHPTEDIDMCIVKAKEHLLQLDTRRGELYRAFVYVKKSDIMPVTDKSEITVLEISPTKRSGIVEAVPAIITAEESSSKEELPTIKLTSEEEQMKLVKSFYEVEPYIKGLQGKGKLKKYGKYATMPTEEDCYLFVYDKQGNISALLRKSGDVQYNLNTLNEDNVKNYKNCGAIWFQLKD